jgi:16S rRNA (uracil1498-N3)-methyltransferase
VIGEAAAAHLFVADLDDPRADDRDEHHLVRSLRVRAGESLTVSDGRGRWRPCVVASVTPLRLEATAAVVQDPRPDPPISVAFAPTKGDRPAWAVQKLTELGVDRIGLLHTDRSVVRWDAERAGHHIGRLETVAREAAMQSRRSCLPEIVGPLSLDSWPGPAALCDRQGSDVIDLTLANLIVGPEGGWSAAELSRDVPVVSLGPTVLRTETAVVAAGALLAALRGGTVRPRRRGDRR